MEDRLYSTALDFSRTVVRISCKTALSALSRFASRTVMHLRTRRLTLEETFVDVSLRTLDFRL